MPFEIIHFRGSDKVLKTKRMKKDVQATMEYIHDVLSGSLHKSELFKQALEEMGWRENGSLTIFHGRRYQFKGLKNKVAIEASFHSYEFLLEGLIRLQLGFDKGNIDTGILILTSQRGEKSPYGSTTDMVKEDVEKFLHPTISLPVTVALFDLGQPHIQKQDVNQDTKQNTKEVQP